METDWNETMPVREAFLGMLNQELSIFMMTLSKRHKLKIIVNQRVGFLRTTQ